jgi:DNA-binding MarR family transcriptional regulator
VRLDCKADAGLQQKKTSGGNATMQDRLTQADYETLAAFRHALRRFANFSTQAAHDAGLTTQQHQALLAIKGHPGAEPMAVGGLAEQLLVAPHTAAELVTRLEAGGLLVKVGDPSDRRRVGIALTPKAEAALDRLTLVHREEVRGLAPRLMDLLRSLDAARQ